MKHNQLLALCLALMVFASSCSVIGGIFKAGIWTGIIIVAVVVLIIIWIISKSTGSK